MLNLPSTLDPELLYLFVFGPGFGETVLLRVPPDQWMIVDSFKCAKRPAADFVVGRYGGTVVSIILTHPHADHYSGILELIDSYPNTISSAMLVEWNDVRLLLGADVPNTEWPDIGAIFPGLGNHTLLKVPHHGSREAIHEVFGVGPQERCWIVTPFTKAPGLFAQGTARRTGGRRLDRRV